MSRIKVAKPGSTPSQTDKGNQCFFNLLGHCHFVGVKANYFRITIKASDCVVAELGAREIASAHNSNTEFVYRLAWFQRYRTRDSTPPMLAVSLSPPVLKTHVHPPRKVCRLTTSTTQPSLGRTSRHAYAIICVCLTFKHQRLSLHGDGRISCFP
jgi:hypothetical protein